MTPSGPEASPDGAASRGGAVSNVRRVRAAAKVNVFLRVLGARDDGFHDLETLVAPISLADDLTIHAASDPEFSTLSLSLEVEGDAALLPRVPVDQSNLILRAARTLAEHAGIRGFAEVTLRKRIPVSAGLGGGSADAAATLRALNDLWGSALDWADMLGLAARVGSDVPALLGGGPAFARGRGERVDRVELPGFTWRVAAFDFEVSAAEAFAWWDRDGARTGPRTEEVLEAALSGDPGRLGPLMFNDLEGPVMRRHPDVRTVKERFIAAGAVGAVMCGSGPSVAALLADGVELDPSALPPSGEVTSS